MVPSDVFDDEDDFMFGDDDGDDDKMASDTEYKAKSQTKTAKPLLSDDDDDAGSTWQKGAPTPFLYFFSSKVTSTLTITTYTLHNLYSDTEDKAKSQTKTAKPLLTDDDDDAGNTRQTGQMDGRTDRQT